jgi:hypothetical protein
LNLANQGAGQFTYEQRWCARRGFFVLCIMDPQYIARILYQSMLKASSGCKEGATPFTGELDTPKRPIRALVRTAWSTPERVKFLESFLFKPIQEECTDPDKAEAAWLRASSVAMWDRKLRS